MDSSPTHLGGPWPGCSLEVPEGFLDVRGLISCLFWVSRAEEGARSRLRLLQHLPHTWFLLPHGCSAPAWTLKVEFCTSPSPQHLSLLTAHPVVFKALLLLSGLCNCLSGMFSSVMLVACFCLCPSCRLCDCGLPTQTFLMVLPYLPCLFLAGLVPSARACPAPGTGNHWCLESAPLGSVSPQPRKYSKQPGTLVTSLSHTLPQAHLKPYTLHCRSKSQVPCVCALPCC